MIRRFSCFIGLTLVVAVLASPALAQIGGSGKRVSKAQIVELIRSSGLTPEQIRERLKAAGYPASLLDQFMGSKVDTTGAGPSAETVTALSALGLSPDDLEAAKPDSVPGIPGQPRIDLDASALRKSKVFGIEVFRRVTTRFQPLATGPVDPSYKVGPGDLLVLILTGEVELAHQLEVNREGFVVIPQVGQLYVSGQTLANIDVQLFKRLKAVYSGIGRGANARTKFQITVARLRTNQVFVVGDVVQPGSYQISSAATVLTALYLAGGPLETGSFRQVFVRRGRQVIDTLDIYDYLLRGDTRNDIRLESGDVVFVPIRKVSVEITGAVVRPAIYELAPGETLKDLVAAAGGFLPTAVTKRLQIERILPPAKRVGSGRDRITLDLSDPELGRGEVPAFGVEAGDVVRVFAIPEVGTNAVMVRGNVWIEGPVGFRAGMTLSDAIRLAGGPKPDVYLGRILVARLNPDSTRTQLRSAFKDSSGAVTDDLELQENDDIHVFSRTAFRPNRTIVVTGAVKLPGRIPYREGMTLRDAVLEAGGMTEDAWLTEASIARLPENRVAGTLAKTIRVPLDSTYLFDRGPDGKYQGPPGIASKASGAAETVLQPYDNVLILRQPDWELQRTVVITGEVKFPGRYALEHKSERLVDLIARAGGLTKEAYPRGAELYRMMTGRPESNLQVINRLMETPPIDSLSKDSVADSVRLGTTLSQRVGLNLENAIKKPKSGDNLIMRDNDSLFIPEYRATVRVLGAVNSPTAVIYHKGWNAYDYIAAAGGATARGDRNRSYVVQPGGSVESVKGRWLWADSKPEPLPGGVVVVPERDPAEKRDWAGLLGAIAQIVAGMVTVVVVATR